MTLDETVATYCAAWDEPDRRRRLALLERSVTADAIYVDPTVELRGIAELVDVVEVAGDGRLARIVGFVGPLHPPGS